METLNSKLITSIPKINNDLSKFTTRDLYQLALDKAFMIAI